MSRADGDPRMLAKLRAWRVPAAPDRSIGEDVTRLIRDVKRKTEAVGGLDQVWASAVPPTLAAKSRVDRFTKGGDLHVVADDAATRYAIDVWLRSGGLAQLRTDAARGIRSVKLK